MSSPTTQINNAATPTNIVGGPGAESTPGSDKAAGAAPLPASPAGTEPQLNQQPAAAKKIFIGDMVFESEEEALKYANSLSFEHRQLKQKANPVIQQANSPDPGDILFEDPKAALKMLEERIETKIETRNQARQEEKNIWDRFYTSHPDLVGLEDIVEIQRTKNWGRIADLPVERALSVLATEARQYVSKIRGNAGQEQQLSSRPAVVAGSSGTTPPTVSAQTERPKTFVEEVAEMRRKRQTKT